MTDLNEQFQKAGEDVKELSEKPSNDTLLKLYSLFKQGSVGDVTGKRPGMTNFKGRAKYDAWKKLQGASQEIAKQDYIDLVVSLKE